MAKRPKSTKAYREAVEEHGEKFELIFDYYNDIDDGITACTDAYMGCFRNLEAYAEDYMDQTGSLAGIPENLRRYFDYASWGRDLESEGSIMTFEGSEGLHVFTQH